MKALELFSGLGGWRYALGPRGSVAAAYDISPAAGVTYALNFGEGPLERELARVPAGVLAAHGADTWLLSPPCQPYCRMGKGLDLRDRRSAALLHLLDVLEGAPPRRLVLENVEGFLGSGSHERFLRACERAGLHVRTLNLCPTRFGIPNRRPRVYLLASREALPERVPPDFEPGPLAPFLDPDPDPGLFLPEEVVAKHGRGLDLVGPEERRSSCFIGGYGQRYVGSGSFLRAGNGVRRFSPEEVARILGLPPSFRFPASLSQEKRYKLLGNGLSIPVAAWVLDHFEDAGKMGAS